MANKVSIIAFEFPPFRGGIANYSHSFAKRLYKHGYKVCVFTLNPSSRSDGYQVINPGWHYQPNLSIPPLRKMISLGYRLYQFFFFARMIFQVLREHRSSQILLTSLFFDFSRLAVRIFRLIGIRYQIILHGLDIYELPSTRPGFLEMAASNAERVIFNSKSTQRLYVSKYPDPESQLIFPPLLDTSSIDRMGFLSFEQLEKELGIQQETNLIVSVCRLVYRKGIDVAIAAAVDFLRHNQDWSYVIAGEGKELITLKKMVPEDLNDRIIFVGSISEKMKISMLHYARVFLMPNRGLSGDVEGFGISFIEASYLRNWVIGGNNGGVPEAVDTTSNGFLVNVDENAVSTITQRLDFIVGNLERTDELERGRQFVVENFTLQRKLVF